ncbi:MAG: glycyl-radical enzyme activating protein [Deltaproteobacteria bacterium]|jgi:pyruvate formate lyase activating enzyme|nr:glycyl-radical enzyme activating protein [Deltaproteobacteria bacterium]
MASKGVIFNLQRFSVHDGKGIRSIVFFKGCPLRCRWCSNPESQDPDPEPAFNPSLCLGAAACGRCLSVCPSEALSGHDGGISWNFEKCRRELKCVRVCPSGARIVHGERLTAEEIIARVEEDQVFYQRSGGGLTLSGGEPLAQSDFCLEVLALAKKRRLKTAIETAGHVPSESLLAALPYLDQVIYDLKHWDPEKHLEYTGRDNSLILQNLNLLAEGFQKDLILRIPVIPGFNDTADDLKRIRKLFPGGSPAVWELLPYHRLGASKHAFLGRVYPYGDFWPDGEKFGSLKAAFHGEDPGRRRP